MEGLFLQVLNMSISAGWLIAVVLVLRLLLQKAKAPKTLCYVLWAFVAVRLLCPISVESGLSLLPSGETISEDVIYGENPKIDSGIESVDSAVNKALSQLIVVEGTVNPGNTDTSGENNALQEEHTNIGDQVSDNENVNASTGNVNGTGNSGTVGDGNLSGNAGITDETQNPASGNTSAAGENTNTTAGNTNNAGHMNNTESTNDAGYTDAASANPLQSLIDTASVLWGIGIVVMLVYTLISYIRLQNRVNASVRLRDNLWICDEIQSPFILGLLDPRIYLPSHIDEEQIPYIVAHENEHLKYHDNWWKPLGFGILAIHWFNPFVWVAYSCMCCDIELACDERVIRLMDNVEKKKYTESLLLCSSPRHLISACPVAFGEIGIKERIKSVVNYKKPATWLVGIGVVLCIVVAVCFLTNPKERVRFEEWTSSITVEDIYWAKVSKNYGQETISCHIPKDGYGELCEVLGTITNEDCSTGSQIGDELDSYELTISRENKEWQFFCYEDGVVGLLFEDYETGAYYGCEGEVLIIESQKLWDYIRNVAEEDDALELTPTNAMDNLFDETFAKLTVYSSYYGMQRTCMITKESKVPLNLPSFIYTYEWERVENSEISSTDTWVRIESADGTSEMVFWDIDEGLIACTLPNYADEVTFYWKAVEKESTESEASFFTNVFRLCLDACTSNGYYKTHNAESLLKVVELAGMEELYADYDGEEICHYFVDNSAGMMTRDDLVYYCTDETDIQKVIQTMFSVMLDPLMEPSENRPFTVTEYRLYEMEVVQGSENVWFIPCVQGHYKYDGVDLVTFEEQLPYTEMDEDGLIPFFGQGSHGMFYYILIKNGDVYRLERGDCFTEKYDYLLKFDEQLEAAEYEQTVLYETKADLTHDGIKDVVKLVMYMPNDAGDFGEAASNLNNQNNYVRVKVYDGYIYDDSSEPIYVSEKFGVAAEHKGTIGLTTSDKEDYLFIAHMSEENNQADYSYSIFYLEDGEVKTVESDALQFSMNDNPYAWVEQGQAFQFNLSQRGREGMVLATFEWDIHVSQDTQKLPISTYFYEIWNCETMSVSRAISERIAELQLKPIAKSLQTEFINLIEEQVAEYLKERESSYVTGRPQNAFTEAIASWEDRIKFTIEDAEIGYVYGDVYEASETERVVRLYEVGYLECSTPFTSNNETSLLLVNTEHLLTFQLENGQWNFVSDAYTDARYGYQQGLGLEDWEVYFYGISDDYDLERLHELQEMDLSVWFEDYNGEEVQCIRGPENKSPAIREDIVYYRTDETDIQVVLKRMIEEMMNPLMEASDERRYTIIQYRIDDSEVYQIDEQIWYVTYMNGYYKYEGVDMVTFEQALEYEKADEDGLISFDRQGSDGVFSYVLLKEGDVYCLRRFESMDY